MASKVQVYLKVINARKSGMSYSQLSKKFGMAKSTVSLWCKDVIISDTVKQRIYDQWFVDTKKGRDMGALYNKRKRNVDIRLQKIKAKEMLGSVSGRDFFIMGLSLYWAEGGKKGDSTGFSFINSDPKMIILVISWLKRFFNLNSDDIKLTVSVNIFHKYRITKILSFWSVLLEWPLNRFGNTIYINTPQKRIYKNSNSYYGMIRVRVKGSVWLRRRIVSMIGLINNLPM